MKNINAGYYKHKGCGFIADYSLALYGILYNMGTVAVEVGTGFFMVNLSQKCMALYKCSSCCLSLY